MKDTIATIAGVEVDFYTDIKYVSVRKGSFG